MYLNYGKTTRTSNTANQVRSVKNFTFLSHGTENDTRSAGNTGPEDILISGWSTDRQFYENKMSMVKHLAISLPCSTLELEISTGRGKVQFTRGVKHEFQSIWLTLESGKLYSSQGHLYGPIIPQSIKGLWDIIAGKNADVE